MKGKFKLIKAALVYFMVLILVFDTTSVYATEVTKQRQKKSGYMNSTYESDPILTIIDEFYPIAGAPFYDEHTRSQQTYSVGEPYSAYPLQISQLNALGKTNYNLSVEGDYKGSYVGNIWEDMTVRFKYVYGISVTTDSSLTVSIQVNNDIIYRVTHAYNAADGISVGYEDSSLQYDIADFDSNVSNMLGGYLSVGSLIDDAYKSVDGTVVRPAGASSGHFNSDWLFFSLYTDPKDDHLIIDEDDEKLCYIYAAYYNNSTRQIIDTDLVRVDFKQMGSDEYYYTPKYDGYNWYLNEYSNKCVGKPYLQWQIGKRYYVYTYIFYNSSGGENLPDRFAPQVNYYIGNIEPHDHTETSQGYKYKLNHLQVVGIKFLQTIAVYNVPDPAPITAYNSYTEKLPISVAAPPAIASQFFPSSHPGCAYYNVLTKQAVVYNTVYNKIETVSARHKIYNLYLLPDTHFLMRKSYVNDDTKNYDLATYSCSHEDGYDFAIETSYILTDKTTSTLYGLFVTSTLTDIDFVSRHAPEYYTATVKDIVIDRDTDTVLDQYIRTIQCKKYSSTTVNALTSAELESKNSAYKYYTDISPALTQTVTEALPVVEFEYRDARIDCTVNVIDAYYDTDGTSLLYEVNRLTEHKKEFDTYSYAKITPHAGYTCGTDSLTGVCDSATINVVFRYTKIPTFNIVVVDQYFDEYGDLEQTNVRIDEEHEVGYAYSYDALVTSGYSVLGESNYSGTLISDTSILFAYDKTLPDQSEFEVTVLDKYLDTRGVQEKLDLRQQDTLSKATLFTCNALDNLEDGYITVGVDRYALQVNCDLSLTFTYQKLEADTVVVTVKDVYLNDDGNEIRNAIRRQDILNVNDEYTYSALDAGDDFKVVSSLFYSGTAVEDTTITFVYQTATARTVTIRGYILDELGRPVGRKLVELNSTRRIITDDNGYYEFIDVIVGEHDLKVYKDTTDSDVLTSCKVNVSPTRADSVDVLEHQPKEVTVSDEIYADIFNIDVTYKIYYATVVDKYYDYLGNLERAVTRTPVEYMYGDTYTYSALVVPDYVLTSENDTYFGVIDKSIDLVFEYTNTARHTPTLIDITLHANGGKFDEGVTTYTYSSEFVVDEEVPVVLLTNALETVYGTSYESSYQDHTLLGWGTSPDSDTVISEYKVKASNNDLYAIWESNTVSQPIKITLHANGGNFADGVTEFIYSTTKAVGDTISVATLQNALEVMYGIAYKDSYPNHTLVGWGLNTTSTQGILDYTIKATGNDLYAIWHPNGKEHKVTVIDNYYNTNNILLNSVVRITEIVQDSVKYYVAAKSVDGYEVTGTKSYNEVIRTDSQFVFSYKRTNTSFSSYKVSVFDKYLNSDGTPIKEDLRLAESKAPNTEYYYEAKTLDDFVVVGVTSYNGLINSDLRLVFTYQARDTVKSSISNVVEQVIKPSGRCHTITVVDKFILSRDASMYEFKEGQFLQNTYDGVAIWDVSVIGNTMFMVRREVRCSDSYIYGSFYKYNALNVSGFTVISSSQYSGTVTQDMTLEFVYSNVESSNALTTVLNSSPSYPWQPEPATGNRYQLHYLIIIILSLIVIVYTYRRCR